jgi:hypothetical protein
VGGRVTRGQSVGRVGHTGPTSNGTPHLHYEQGYDADGDGSVSWGFEGAERVTARFDGKAYGPAPGGEWRNVESRNGCGDMFGADFNADGIGDIFSETTGTLNIWNGKGDNEFGPAVEIGGGWAPYDGTLTSLGDVNRDGHDDIAAMTDGTLYVWNGEGGNKFGPATAIGPGWAPYF